MNLLLKFIVTNLILIHKGTALMKIQGTVTLAVLSSPLAFIADNVSNWLHLNIEFASFVFGAIVIDHILGSCVHAFIKRDFKMLKNITGMSIKISLVIIVHFLGLGIVFILGKGVLSEYFNKALMLTVFLYPAGSALVNCAIITKGKFPPVGFMKKIKYFNETLDLKGIKGEDRK